MSRHTILSLSIVASLVVHVGLLVASPRISMYAPSALPNVYTPQRIKIQAVPIPPAPAPKSAQAKGGGGAKKRPPVGSPASIEDLLKRETEHFAPDDSLLKKPLDVPQLSERVASDNVSREYHLAPDQESLKAVDAKVIEIAEQTARQGIEIARRVVTPSTDRVLAENEFPVMRGPGDSSAPIALGAAPVVSLIDSPAEAREAGGGEPAPAFEAPSLAQQEPVKKALPALEQVLARSPVVDRIKQESPFKFMDDLVDVKMDTFIRGDEKEGFFRLQIVPRKGETIAPLPKDVTFIIDASTSILQRKLDNTARGTQEMIQQLRPEDRFSVVVFRDTASSFQPGLVGATPENKAAAIRFLANLQSRGETDVYSALRPVVQAAPRAGVPGVVFVATDGRPTAGVRDARTIINALTQENLKGQSIFAVGGGNTVNRYLLDLLAYRNKGESLVLPSFDSLNRDMPAFFTQFGEPLLVNLRGDYGRIDEDNVFPKEIPDFYKGRVVTVYGRFNPAKDSEFTMRISGDAKNDKKEILFKTDLRKATKGDDKIARNWAFQKVYFLIGEICRVGEKPELLSELRQLCKKYNIRTIYDD